MRDSIYATIYWPLIPRSGVPHKWPYVCTEPIDKGKLLLSTSFMLLIIDYYVLVSSWSKEMFQVFPVGP